jgi:enoyl-CoA hydratase
MVNTTDPTLDTVTLERDGHVLVMGLNRPEKYNAFTVAMLADLSRAYALLERDDTIRAGVLVAHGKHFTAGLDLVDVAPYVVEGRNPMPEDGRDPWRLDGAWTKPVVAATQGRCLTLGIELRLAADIRVAAADTRFAQLEVLRGIFPFGGATLRWPRQSGWGNAMRWLLTGDDFDAAEALRMGMVQEVVTPGDQLPRALALADVIAKQAPLGVFATLASSRAALPQNEHVAAARLMPDLVPIMGSEDVQEGLQAFVQRRPGAFRGR